MSADPTGQRQQSRGGGSHDGNPVELAGGEVSGQIKDTGMFPKLPRVD